MKTKLAVTFIIGASAGAFGMGALVIRVFHKELPDLVATKVVDDILPKVQEQIKKIVLGSPVDRNFEQGDRLRKSSTYGE